MLETVAQSGAGCFGCARGAACKVRMRHWQRVWMPPASISIFCFFFVLSHFFPAATGAMKSVTLTGCARICHLHVLRGPSIPGSQAPLPNSTPLTQPQRKIGDGDMQEKGGRSLVACVVKASFRQPETKNIKITGSQATRQPGNLPSASPRCGFEQGDSRLRSFKFKSAGGLSYGAH